MRVAGTDRYTTSATISHQNYTSSSNVIISTGIDYPDALAASSLAGALRAPILLVSPNSLPSSVNAEISRLGAKHAIIAGGTSAVGTAVANALEAKGLTVERIAGANRYSTAGDLGRKTLATLGKTSVDTVFVARGNDFADALSVSSAAYARKLPVILTLPWGMPNVSVQALRDLKPAHIVILGSTAAVGTRVESLMRTLSPSVVRVAGGTRYGTSTAMAAYAIGKGWLSATNVGLASGQTFPDAVGGGPAMGGKGKVLVLTATRGLSPETGAFMRKHGEITTITLFGGLPALQSGVTNGIRAVYNPHWIGYYIPGAPLSLSPLTSLQSVTGVHAAVSNYFQNTSQGFTSTQAKNAAANGSIPLITLEFWNPASGVNQSGYSLRAIANGNFDSYLHSYAKAAKAFGKTVYLRPLHEMNGNWYPWGGSVNGNSPSYFGTAWRRIHGIFTAEGATNVKFVWCPNVDSVPNTTANAIRNYWPGDAYVDFIGLDGYNFGSPWRSFSSVYGSAYSKVAALSGKPIFIAEIGCATTGDKAGWIANMFYVLPRNFPRIIGVTWFNADKERDWRIESTSSTLSSFKSGLSGF